MAQGKKKKSKLKTKKRSLSVKLFILSSKLLTLITTAVGLFVLMVYLGLFGPLPSNKELASISNELASEVYTIDHTLMGKYYRQNRMSLENKDISKHVINALVATEDSRFFEHKGVDIISIARVLFRTIILGDHRQGGGSTISQQLAKNLYPRQSYGAISIMVNKWREIFIASRLEKTYSKDDILILYLNTVPFGEDVYGIEAASQRFFSKASAKLSPDEAATLVGMLAANTAYNPRLHPDAARARRNTVLSRMEEQKFISTTASLEYKNSPLAINYRRIDHNTGIAPYFRSIIKRKALQILNEKYGDHYNIYTDGLKIYTTIDPTLQSYAERAVKAHMQSLQREFTAHWKGRNPWRRSPEVFDREWRRSAPYQSLLTQGKSEDEIRQEMLKLKRMTIFGYPQEHDVNISSLDSISHYLKILNTGFMVMQPQTGNILAWVGGVSHKYFPYDHVTSRRQVGSTFKPIVYAAAIENGMAPCEFISNEQRVYEDYEDWSPSNANGRHEGFYSLKGGLSHSVNTISAEIMFRTGIDKVLALAQKLGVSSTLPAVPSIALGTGEISLQEMLGVYTCFANEGKTQSSVGLLRIEDRKGKILYEHSNSKELQVISKETAQLMNYMLQGVVQRGTAQALTKHYQLKSPLAGKTGTTQNSADGWFIGYTPKLVAGAWVGAESPKVHFRSSRLGQGAHMALPIFALFMKQVEADVHYRNYTQTPFDTLTEAQAALVNCEDYLEEDPNSNIVKDLFSKDKKQERKEKRALKKEERIKDGMGIKGRIKGLFKRGKKKKD